MVGCCRCHCRRNYRSSHRSSGHCQLSGWSDGRGCSVWARAECYPGAVLGSIYGAVTHGKKPTSEEMGYANARETVQQSMAADIAQQQAQVQAESYSRGFQDAVQQSRAPGPAQATR